MRKQITSAFGILSMVSISACTATFGERHYFGAFEESTGEVTNFYRLTVSGKARLSSARYLSGLYDERALDLFFNEIRTDKNNTSKIFNGGVTEPGTSDTIKPLSPNAGSGAFVLILSTDADSVANTIGSFAESQVIAQAITSLVSKDKIEAKQQSDADIPVIKATGTALEGQLASQINDATNAKTGEDSERAYRRILSTIARGLGHNEAFGSFTDARRWFALEKRTANDE